jgi:hypothetical protein
VGSRVLVPWEPPHHLKVKEQKVAFVKVPQVKVSALSSLSVYRINLIYLQVLQIKSLIRLPILASSNTNF